MDTHIERAQPEDAPDILHLLDQHRLPIDGLRDHLATALVARQQGRIVGSAALEVYADGALLRSVAVAPEAQGHGLGHEITASVIRMAQALNVPAIYLLTTTAERYFQKFGFERITRTDVPAAVRTSVEFTSACPSSAVVMRKPLESSEVSCLRKS